MNYRSETSKWWRVLYLTTPHNPTNCIVIVTLYIEQKIQEREDVKATGGNIYMYLL